jgi:hypothetical protein
MMANLETRKIHVENVRDLEGDKETTAAIEASLLKWIATAQMAADDAQQKLVQKEPGRNKSPKFRADWAALVGVKRALRDCRSEFEKVSNETSSEVAES